MISSTVGIYAARIISEKNLKENKKEVKVVGPYAINFDKQTKQFEIVIEGPLEEVFYNQNEPRLLEIYIREK